MFCLFMYFVLGLKVKVRYSQNTTGNVELKQDFQDLGNWATYRKNLFLWKLCLFVEFLAQYANIVKFKM